MNQPDATKLLKPFFNALPDSAVGGADESNYYVNRSDDDEHDPVAILRQQIEWSPDAGDTYLFSGLRGCGKTTELNRLVKELREQGIAAFYCDASIYLNLNDPQLTLAELLMTALAGLSDAVEQQYGKNLLADSIWQRTKRLLGATVELTPTVSLGAAGTEVQVEATLKENPEFRHSLVKFARESTQFFNEARQFAEEVSKLVRAREGDGKIVLVVDSLERLSAPTGDEHRLFDSLKQVFFNEPTRLRLPGFSVIYSAPPYLHAVLPNVGGGFTRCVALPNFKVLNHPPAGEAPTPNAPGISKLVDILGHRFPEWSKLLSLQVVQHLAWMSGGNVRRFYKLLKGVALKASLAKSALPIQDTDAGPVQHALAEASQPLQWLIAEDYVWLNRVMAGEGIAEHIADLKKDLPSIIRLFDHSLVLDYQNGQIWHQVPPIVRAHVKDKD